MGSEGNGAQTTGEEQQGQQVEPEGGEQQSQQPNGQQAQEVGAGGEGAEGDGGSDDVDAEYKAALADRDKKIAELEAQIAEASKSVESANELAAQIEKLKAGTDAERVGYELKLAGCRSVKTARVLLGEHEGDVAALKKAEPWLFGEAVGGGATGLEPAGASKGESEEMKRWYEIAGIEVKE